MNQKEKLNKVTATSARFSRIGAMSLGSKIAMGILALVVLMSVLSPFVSPYGPDQIFDKWSAPSGEHLFGTDHVGRDIFARVLYGGRFSLLIGLCSTLIALFFGAIIGSIAAVVRKSFSEAIMRVMDIIMAVPGIAMAAALCVRESTTPPRTRARTSRSPITDAPLPSPMSAGIWARDSTQALSPSVSRQRSSTSSARPSSACTWAARVSPATIRTPSRRAGVEATSIMRSGSTLIMP